MHHNLKTDLTKYLFAVASLLPVAKSASGNDNGTCFLPLDGEYTLAFSAGFEHLLPSSVINSQIHGKDLEGFNPGVFAEIGAFKWSGQHGSTNYEHHIGFSGRFDYHNFHSRAYNVNNAVNANVLHGEPLLYVDPAQHGCAHVQDFIGTFNINSNIGWYGCVFGANCGLGLHFDNHGNFGPVIALGAGIGYRFNESVRLDARWRLNMFPCENLNSKTRPATTPGLRNNAEMCVIYKLRSYRSKQRYLY